MNQTNKQPPIPSREYTTKMISPFSRKSREKIESTVKWLSPNSSTEFARKTRMPADDSPSLERRAQGSGIRSGCSRAGSGVVSIGLKAEGDDGDKASHYPQPDEHSQNPQHPGDPVDE